MRASRKAQGRRLGGNNPGVGSRFCRFGRQNAKTQRYNGICATCSRRLLVVVGKRCEKCGQRNITMSLLSLSQMNDIEECAPSRQIPAMAECLRCCEKRQTQKYRTRVTFVCLKRCPHGELEALEIAKAAPQVQKYPPALKMTIR